MAMIINCLNHKGGTGKTTTAVNLGYGLAQKGLKGLCVDLDEQGNLTSILLRLEDQYPVRGTHEFLSRFDELEKNEVKHPNLISLKEYIQKGGLQRNVFDVLMKRFPIRECIHHTPYENLDIIPYSPDLLDAEARLQSCMNGFVLQDALKEVENEYDFIIFDNHPAENAITFNAIMATSKEEDIHLLPIKVDRGGLEGVARTLEKIYSLNDEPRNNLKSCVKLLVTMKNRNQEDERWNQALHDAFENEILESTIRYQAKPVIQASLDKRVLLERQSNVGKDYQKAVDEIYEYFKEKHHERT